MADWSPPDTYGVVCTANRQYIYVSIDVLDQVRAALAKRRCIDSAEEPEYLEFEDVVGSTVTIAARQIECVYDSTGAIRQRDREMHEHFKAGRPYDD